jgi:hypothetical protein
MNMLKVKVNNFSRSDSRSREDGVTFSPSQYDAMVERIKAGVTQIGAKNQQVMPAARHATSHWYLPDGVKSAVLWMARKLTQISEWLIRKSEELLAGVFAPVVFFEAAWKWQDVRAKASTVESSINPAALGSRRWEGDAKTNYRSAISLQSPAAGRIKTVAGTTATSLYVCAGAGLIFYAALGLILYQFISTLGAALAALFSGVLSLAGFVAAVGDCGVTAGMIWGAITAAAVCLGAQAQQMGTVRSDATDNGSFPNGHWPKAVNNA